MFKSKKVTKANNVLNPYKKLADESRKLISFYINKYKKPIDQIIEEYGVKDWYVNNAAFNHNGYVAKFTYRYPKPDKKSPNSTIHNSWTYYNFYKYTWHHCCDFIKEMIDRNGLEIGVEYNIGGNKIIKVIELRQIN